MASARPRTEKQMQAMRDAAEFNRTVAVCPQGHDYPPGKVGIKAPQRRCKVCRAQASREYRARVKARKQAS